MLYQSTSRRCVLLKRRRSAASRMMLCATVWTSTTSTVCHGFSPFSSMRMMRGSTPISRSSFRQRSLCSFSTTKNINTPSESDDRKILQTPLEVSMTQDAISMVNHAIEAVSPYTAIQNHVHIQDDGRTLQVGGGSDPTTKSIIDLTQFQDIVVVAFGKASSSMATALIQQLTTNTSNSKALKAKLSGCVICKDDHATTDEIEYLSTTLPEPIPIRYASHPVPDDRSNAAAQEVLELVQSKASSSTLVLCCISGGGSALFCSPQPPLTLQDLQDVNSKLLQSGMGIEQMNVIRKRLERGKGGKLAAAAYPSSVHTFVLSDVLGDPLDLIASGPTVPDTSSWQDAIDLVYQYNLDTILSETVMDYLNKGPSPDSEVTDNAKVFARAHTTLVGNNELAVQAAASRAKELGYTPQILGTHIEGEAKEIPHVYIGMAKYLQQQAVRDSNIKLPVALIAGGETTVKLPSDPGKGGRNQELALSSALLLDKLKLRNIAVCSVGTDGTDGPTDAAGAVVDGSTVGASVDKARKAMADHDAYPYLESLTLTKDNKDVGPLLKTGPTGTNVADVCVILVHPSH